MESTSILTDRENYFKIVGMIIGLLVILPFIGVYRTIKFMRE